MNDLLGTLKGGGGASAPERNGDAGASGSPPAIAEARRGIAADDEDIDLEAAEGGLGRGRGEGEDGEGATAAEAEASMGTFFAEVGEIKALMADIRAQAQRLSEANEEGKTVTRSKEMKALRERMRSEINGVSRNAENIKRRLAQLEADNASAVSRGLVEPGSASERTRSSITAALKRRLRELMAEFAELRGRLNREYRETVERRVYTVTGQRPDEAQIEGLIETGESENVFQTAILEQGRGAVADAVAEIRERHNAVVELEKSLLELHQIFLDMAVLVEAQGEQLDSIEAQVARSVEYVQAGTTHLVAAKQHQRNTRKWICCGIIAAIILILLIVLLTVGLTGGFN